MEVRQKDIYQWTHQHPKGVIMIYKNLTTEYNLFEDVFFDNQNLRVIEPKSMTDKTKLNLVIKPMEQLTIILEKTGSDG